MTTRAQADEIWLSENFKASEWFVSADHPEVAAAMELPDEYLYKLRIMASTILQPLRDKFGPLTILSGYRSRELNKLVKGSESSQHRLGEAVDIVCGSYPASIVAKAIMAMLPYSYGQVILYLNKDGKSNFLHVSLPQMDSSKHRGALINHKGKFLQWQVAAGYINDKALP